MIRSCATLLCGLLLAATAHAFKGVDVTGQGYGGDFRLIGHDGKPRTPADFLGKVVVLSFGFTHCPDVCPTTLATLAGAIRALGDEARSVQVVFVTIDPERDTPQVLAKYVIAFEPGFLGLSGDAATTRQIARNYHVFYQKVGDSFDHSAGSYVIDRAGRARLFLPQTLSSADMAYDIRQLLRE